MPKSFNCRRLAKYVRTSEFLKKSFSESIILLTITLKPRMVYQNYNPYAAGC